MRRPGPRLLAVVLPLAGAARAGAQDVAEPVVLAHAASTRALAMGDAYVAGRGSEMLFYNPAQLAGAPGLAASVQRARGGRTLGVLAGSMAIGRWGLGAGVERLDYDVTQTFEPTPSQGGYIPPRVLPAQGLVASLGASATFKGIRWGAAAKMIEQRGADVRDAVPAADLGASLDIGFVAVGLAVQNLGPALKLVNGDAALPRRATLGAMTQSHPLGAWLDLTGAAAVSMIDEGDVDVAAGGELAFTPLEGRTLALRLGRPRDGTRHDPITAGLGLSLDRVSIDWAWARGVQRVGVRVR